MLRQGTLTGSPAFWKTALGACPPPASSQTVLSLPSAALPFSKIRMLPGPLRKAEVGSREGLKGKHRATHKKPQPLHKAREETLLVTAPKWHLLCGTDTTLCSWPLFPYQGSPGASKALGCP